MHLRPPHAPRAGLTLLEVIVSVAIFLIGIIAVGGLIQMSTNLATDIAAETEALQLCQSKLGEVVAGAVPLQAQPEQPFEHNPKWTWSMECTQGEIPSLWQVEVTVKTERSGGLILQRTLNQLVLDPLVKGATAQPSTDSSAESSSTTPEATTPTTPPSGSTP